MPDPTKLGYPSGHKPRSVKDQLYILKLLFPEILGYGDDTYNAECLADRPPPDGAEAWFAVPNWRFIAPTYQQALVEMLKILARGRHFEPMDIVWYQDLKPHMLRTYDRCAELFKLLRDRQAVPENVLIVPAQLGLRYRGLSIMEARKIFRDDEFGLDPFTIASILLTHPERLDEEDRHGHLWIKCGGSELSVDEDPPDFAFGVGFGFENADEHLTVAPVHSEESGTFMSVATGFVPEPLED